MEVKEIKKKLKKSLDKQRYQHTLGVMYTAGCLAMANGYPIEKAMLAGLLHDCAKCLSTEKKIGLCVKKNIDITEVEISNPGLLHAKAGMVLAEEEYGIKDTQILHAIRVVARRQQRDRKSRGWPCTPVWVTGFLNFPVISVFWMMALSNMKI